ncbi:MAG: DUF1826 domain-containing protein [Pseudomonadota bacterium]
MTALLREQTVSEAKSSSTGVVIANGPEAFDALHKADCAASVWQRTFLPNFQKWLDDLSPKSLPQGRLILRPAAVADAVTQLCEIAQTPASEERDLFINDIAVLAELFAASFKCAYLRLRIEKITDNACSKFHRDTIKARLVCTYRGTGTHYGIPVGDNEPSEVFTVPTGSAFLMRGTLWPETPYSNLKHRSPPINGTDETRLLLVLDPVFDPEDAI